MFVTEVLAETGADLDRRAKTRTRILHRKRVVETLDHPIPAGQNLVPALHEIVVHGLLLRAEGSKDLRPLCNRLIRHRIVAVESSSPSSSRCSARASKISSSSIVGWNTWP